MNQKINEGKGRERGREERIKRGEKEKRKGRGRREDWGRKVWRVTLEGWKEEQGRRRRARE
jgi:hypothetical protein